MAKQFKKIFEDAELMDSYIRSYIDLYDKIPDIEIIKEGKIIKYKITVDSN